MYYAIATLPNRIWGLNSVDTVTSLKDFVGTNRRRKITQELR